MNIQPAFNLCNIQDSWTRIAGSAELPRDQHRRSYAQVYCQKIRDLRIDLGLWSQHWGDTGGTEMEARCGSIDVAVPHCHKPSHD